MLEITKPTIEQTTLDFSSSGQEPRRVSRLVQDGYTIFNAIELIDWTSPTFQAIVCGACGVPGCSSDGWISLRSTGEFVVFMPAFDEMTESSSSAFKNAPLSYYSDQGVTYITADAYDELRVSIPQLPSQHDIPPLTTREAAQLFQIEAPYQLFGTPPDAFAYNRDVIVGASSGELRERLNVIRTLVQSCHTTDRSATLRLPLEDEDIISLYVDSFDFVDWHALACSGSTCRLMIGSRLVLDFSAAG